MAGPSGGLSPPGSPAGGFDPVGPTVKDALRRLQTAAGSRSPDPDRPDALGAREDRGPDRVSEMEGGDRFLVARRRARRKDLAKEAANVGLASLLVALMSAVVLMGLGAGLDVTAVLAAALGVACGSIVGREVLLDILRNERILREGGRPR